MGIELLPPGRPRIRQQDVHVVRHFVDLLYQSLYICKLCAVGGYWNGLSAWTLIGQSIEGGAGRVAGCGFARGYVDL